MKDFEFGVDQLIVGQAQQIFELVHQVVFVAVHFPVDIDHLPKGFDNLYFFIN